MNREININLKHKGILLKPKVSNVIQSNAQQRGKEYLCAREKNWLEWEAKIKKYNR